MKLPFALFAFLVPALASAAGPLVWFDTDRGPIIVEFDTLRAPATSTHVLQAVDAKHYDGLVFHRSVRNFVIQTGIQDANGAARVRSQTVVSERTNGLANAPGTLGMALSSNAAGQPNYGSGTTQVFINTANNSNGLNGHYTVFARVVHGLSVVAAINSAGNHLGTDIPFRPTLIRKARRVDGYPVMDSHSGSWYDPDNTGRGLSVEISNVHGGDGSPVAIVYWFDYFDGRQIWMNGGTTFDAGASAVTIPLQITEGGQFGDAYDPDQVEFDVEVGSITLRFDDCDSGTFTYQTKLGNGTLSMQRLTVPAGFTCPAD